INVNPKRDFKDVTVADIRMVKAGDICPRCGGTIKMTRGIEAGQVFTLGTKYSKALGATFLDENGREQPMVMGCYGIGVGRTMAAAVEQNNDEDGIIWPKAIAPFEVVVVPVNAKNEEQLQLAESIYAELKKAGVDVLLDDRKDRAGVKFKDADLIGYPLRITVGPKAVAEDVVELKIRRSGETVTAGKADAVQKALELLAGL
ncbi:MAG: proline--tRNA ligase, partial [Selenomonadaceae bacterium]|nr:proline--tRNA ligase [Selenomonadaceae bacterium]